MTKTGWQSLSVKTGGETAELVFENSPTNVLFWLHNRTRGKEERILIYMGGKQVFY
jgi:hypothetical protein